MLPRAVAFLFTICLNDQMISKAFPKKVHINGSVKIQTPPMIVYNQKKAITDKIKRIQ